MWRSITDIPGLVYSVHTTTGGSARPTPVVNLSGTHFQSAFSLGDDGWNFVSVTLDDAGALMLPCNVRITLIEKLATTGGTAGDGLLAAGDSFGTTMDEIASLVSPQTYSDEGVVGAVFDTLAQFHFSASGEYFDTTDFLIEVDGDIPASSFWTNFVGCAEV